MTETLLTEDGRPVLRMERRLAHPPEKVWRAITEPTQLSQWYPFAVTEMDLRVGGKIRFDAGEGTVFGAVITEVVAPRAFAFQVDVAGGTPGGRESDNLLRFELRPHDDGCLLVFTHTFDDRPAAASYGAGWTACFDAMDLLLAGRPVEPADVSVERHEAFVEKFGLGRGVAESTPDGWRVRFVRQLMHQPVDKVWAALTAGVTPEVGDQVPAAFGAGAAGTVTAVVAPRLLEYDGRVRWELSDGPGGARIELTQTGPADRAGEQPTALADWQAHLDDLVRRLIGG